MSTRNYYNWGQMESIGRNYYKIKITMSFEINSS